MKYQDILSKNIKQVFYQNTSHLGMVSTCFSHFFQHAYPNRLGGIQNEFFETLKELIKQSKQNDPNNFDVEKYILSHISDECINPINFPFSTEINSKQDISEGMIVFLESMFSSTTDFERSWHYDKSRELIFINENNNDYPILNVPLPFVRLIQAMGCDQKNTAHDFIYSFFGHHVGLAFNRMQDEDILGLNKKINLIPIEIFNHPEFYTSFLKNINITPRTLSILLTHEAPTLNESIKSQLEKIKPSNFEDMKVFISFLNRITVIDNKPSPSFQNFVSWQDIILKSNPLKSFIVNALDLLNRIPNYKNDTNLKPFRSEFEKIQLKSNVSELSKKPIPTL